MVIFGIRKNCQVNMVMMHAKVSKCEQHKFEQNHHVNLNYTNQQYFEK